MKKDTQQIHEKINKGKTPDEIANELAALDEDELRKIETTVNRVQKTDKEEYKKILIRNRLIMKKAKIKSAALRIKLNLKFEEMKKKIKKGV